MGSTSNSVPESMAVLVLMERRPPGDAPWSTERWDPVAVMPAGEVSTVSERRMPVHQGGGREQYLYGGQELRLYPDATESYWYNLAGRSPSLFVVLREGDDGIPEPFVVTANHDEAGAYMEADGTVAAVPMPADIHQWLERYVAENFRPQERKHRKREKWTEETDRGGRPRTPPK